MDLLFTYVETLVHKSAGIFRAIYVYVSSGVLGGGGVVLMMISGMMILDILLTVGLSGIKMIGTYGGVIWVLVCSSRDVSEIITLTGIVVWVAGLMLVQWGEDMILQ